MCFKTILGEVSQKKLENSKFLDEFVRAFYLLKSEKTAALKNLDSEYIAASESYAQLVGYETVNEIIHNSDNHLPCELAKFSNQYREQDSLIIKYRKSLSFLEIHEFSNGPNIYIFHKIPVINPATNNIVGIEINVEPLQARNMLETIINIHKKPKIQINSLNSITKNIKLGEKQLEVLFCLIIGLKEDKAISDFIEFTKNVKYDCNNVKVQIHRILQKFNINTRDELIRTVVTDKLYKYIPKNFIKSGSFQLTDSAAIIN